MHTHLIQYSLRLGFDVCAVGTWYCSQCTAVLSIHMILMFRLLKRLIRLCLPSVDVQKLDTLITDTAARAEDASAAMAAAVAAAASGMRLKGLVKDHGAKLRVLSMLSTPQVNATAAQGTAQGTAQVAAPVVAVASASSPTCWWLCLCLWPDILRHRVLGGVGCVCVFVFGRRGGGVP